MNELLNKRVTAIWLDKSFDFIRFDCEDGEAYYWRSEGDCCSHSWFNDLLGVSNLIGEVVTEVKTKELSERSSDNCTVFYGVTLSTRLGYFDLVYRNESKGFYGGWITFDGTKPIAPADGYLAITQDWSADEK